MYSNQVSIYVSYKGQSFLKITTFHNFNQQNEEKELGFHVKKGKVAKMRLYLLNSLL